MHIWSIVLRLCDAVHVISLVALQVDLLSKEQGVPLLQLRDRFMQLFPFQDVFCISARHGAGVQELKQYLLERWAGSARTRLVSQHQLVLYEAHRCPTTWLMKPRYHASVEAPYHSV